MDSLHIEKVNEGDLLVSGSEENILPLCSLIRRRLRGEQLLPDIIYDLLLQQKYLRMSDVFWTPVDVTRQAVEWLPSDRRLKILDIGCGVGKFCNVAALSSSHRLFGIEARPHLLEEAKRVSELLSISGISFKCGNVFSYEWSNFDVLYFFNPFAELTLNPIERKLGASSKESTFAVSIKRTVKRLQALPRGKKVITYYTFGAPMPAGFRRIRAQRFGANYLELWEKK